MSPEGRPSLDTEGSKLYGADGSSIETIGGAWLELTTGRQDYLPNTCDIR